jgi:hypothetical protein
VRTVAERFGISDVGLKKICAKAEVPVPERGYWTRLRAGKTVFRTALSPRGPGMPASVSIGPEPHRSYWPRTLANMAAELAEPEPEEPVFSEPIEEIRTRVERKIGKARQERDFSSPHGLIRKLLADDELRRLKPDHASWRFRYTDPLFDSPFERRRLRLLNSLFLGAAKAGAKALMGDDEARKVGLTVGTQDVTFRLDHPSAKPDRDQRWKTRPGKADTLRLAIEGPGAQTWTDSEDRKLESCLTEILVQLILAGEIQCRHRAAAGYQWALERRRELEKEIAAARAEAARKAREARIQAETARRKALLGMAADLRQAEEIRTLVRRVRDTRSEAGTEPAKAWSVWALDVADRLDPLRRLKFEEGGRAQLTEPEWPEPEAPTAETSDPTG